jgi:peptide/nickel transport system substrate-binding protein
MATAMLLLAALLAACGGTQTGGAPTAAPADAPTTAPADAPTTAPSTGATGGTLRVGRTAPPDSLNPGSAYLTEAGDILELVYDALISINLRNEPVPQLAREFSVSDDGTVWTFNLHEGAMWHDGQPVTSADVAFTYNMIMQYEAFGLLKDYTSLITSIETPDPATVVITFEGPVANTDERFSAIPILPQHIWEQFPDEAAALEFENTEMIGSGPFRMTEYRPGEFTRLASVKDHYLTPPKIDEIIFRVFGNPDAMVQAFRAGEVDLIDPPSTVIRVLQNEPNVTVEIGNSLSLTDIIFNVTEAENCPPEADGGKCTGHPALRDVRVRQALAHATDKQQIIDVLVLGLGDPGLGLVMPGHGDAFNDTLQDYAYDPARANQILDEAGYADTNSDGVREMPGDPNTPLELRFNYPNDQFASEGPRLGELLTAMWSEIGIRINVVPLDADALTSVCCPAFDFDIIFWGWSAGVDPSSLLVILTTENIPTGVSETGYSNPEYDELYNQQQVTADREERRALLFQMQEIIHRDVPYIIPYYPQNVNAFRSDRFRGWVIDPEGRLDLFNPISYTVIEPVQ